MTDIKLPPLPDEFLMHPTQGECYTAAQLRARDIEVVRVVLEAAAQECEYEWGGRSSMSDAIRAMEISHD